MVNNKPSHDAKEVIRLKGTTSINSPSGSNARQASRSLLYGEIKLAMQMTPASAKSFATSPEINTEKSSYHIP